MEKIPRGYLVVLGGFLIHFTLGTGFTYGNMSPYITSFLHSRGDHPLISPQDAIWGFALVMLGQGALMFAGGKLYMMWGPRVTSFIGCFIASLGVGVTSLTIRISLLAVCATYGLLFGLGVGIAYVPSLQAGMEWFPNHKGMANGAVVAGFGLGSLAFTQAQTFYLNPDNCSPGDDGYFTDEALLAKVPLVFLVLCGSYVCMQLIGCSLLARPSKARQEEIPLIHTPSDRVLNLSPSNGNGQSNIATSSVDGSSYGAVDKSKLGPIHDEEAQAASKTGSAAKSDPSSKISPLELSDESRKSLTRHYTPWEMLRYRQFYLLWLTFLFNNAILIYINSMYKAYGQTFIKDDLYLSRVGAYAALFNFAGRCLWGCFIDKFGYKRCMIVVTVSLVILTGTLGFSNHGGKYMFTPWIWAIYFFASGTFVLMPTITALTFGIKHMGVNYGLVFTNTVLSAPLVALLTQNLSDYMGWFGTFVMLTGFACCSFLITLFFKDIKEDDDK